jgi:hypothetical protein
MQDVNHFGEAHRVNSTVSVRIMFLDNFQYACAAKAFQRFCFCGLFSRLRQIQSRAECTPDSIRHGFQIFAGRADEFQRLNEVIIHESIPDLG